MSTLATVWPRLGLLVTLADGVTVIDADGRVVEYTQEVRDLLRMGTLLDDDPRDVPTTSPDTGSTRFEHGIAYNFSHPAFAVAGPATRRLWTGFVPSTPWGPSDGWTPRYLALADGELAALVVQHGAHAAGPSAITYTVWVSADGGATWAPTALTVTQASDNAAFAHVAASVPVLRGHMFGVEAVCAGAAIGTDRLNAGVLYRRAA